jgi:hypothetical protein
MFRLEIYEFEQAPDKADQNECRLNYELRKRAD